MSILTSWLASPLPDAAVEIAPEGVSAAVVVPRAGRFAVQAYATEPLPKGAVTASLASPNILDRRLVVETLREVLGRLGTKPKRIALVIPDAAVKVSLLKFEHVPARRDDLEQFVRWQIRKSAPFAIEDASVTYTAGAQHADGAEFLVELARRDIVRDYETVCGNAGAYAGLVDIATVSTINLFLGTGRQPTGDWLLVHMRPAYTSLAILRGDRLIFFRNRAEGEGESLLDLVHQSAMYYQDRLEGAGFARVLLTGRGDGETDHTEVRRSLAERLGVDVQEVNATDIVPMTERINAAPDVSDSLAPLVGILLRTQREVVTA